MADVTIVATDNGDEYSSSIRRIVTTAAGTAYFFYEDACEDLNYKKSTDKGASWGSAALVEAAVNFRKSAIWADWWTPGNTGSLIHIWNVTGDGVYYRALDTSDDSLSCEVLVHSFGSITNTGAAHNTAVLDGVRARGDNLYVVWAIDDVLGNELGAAVSSDDGGCWDDTISTPWESTAIDRIILQPGAESNSNDIWAFFADVSADELDLKVYDSTCDSWSTTNIAASMNINVFTGTYQFDAAPVRSDNGSILIALTDGDTAGTDLKAWKVLSAASITALTDVFTDETDHIGCAIAIDQSTSDIYVFYNGSEGETFATALTTNYKKSTDDGTTWGTETQFNEDAGAQHWEVWADPSVGNPKGGIIIAAWVDTAASGDDLVTNSNNAIAIANATQVARIAVAKSA